MQQNRNTPMFTKQKVKIRTLSMIKQRSWDQYEAAFLIHMYQKCEAGEISRGSAIKEVSRVLRERAKTNGELIDERFRNLNGITMRFGELDLIFGKKPGLKNTSKLFVELAELYKSNKAAFYEILEEKNNMELGNEREIVGFVNWFKKKYPKGNEEKVLKDLLIIEKYLQKRDFISSCLFEISDYETVKKIHRYVNENKGFKANNRIFYDSLLKAITYYMFYMGSQKTFVDSNSDSMEEEIVSCSNLDNYQNWLVNKGKAVPSTAKLYATSVGGLEKFASANGLKNTRLYGVSASAAKETVKELENNSNFWGYDAMRHGRCSVAIKHLLEFLDDIENKSSNDGAHEESRDSLCVIKDEKLAENEEVQNTETNETVLSADQRKKDFANWMLESGMAEASVRPYVSSVGLAGDIAQECGIIPANIFEISDVELLKEAIGKLMVDPGFLEKNETRHNHLRAAWVKYINYSGDPSFSARDIKTDKTDSTEAVSKDSEILYRRLKSMASVYDDIAGHELGWIREKLGLSIELNELKEAVDEIPWIVEVEDGIYSFSPNATPMVEYNRESLTRVLMLRYQNGMQFDSIDLEIFRETYSDIIGDELELTDKQLMTCLCKCGIMYKGRIFPADGIINESTREKLMEYIEKSFSEGKQVLYYKAIYSDLSDVFAYCFNLTDAMMLKPYLEYVCEPDEYFFTDEYISKEKGVKIDHSAEVEEFILAAGKPLSYEDIYEGLSHVSKDIIYGVIKTNSNIIMNEREHYFHYGIFEFSSEDADKITDYINQSIEEDGYCIWSLVYERIQSTMPIFIENNVYLSSLGIRNAVAKKLKGRFHFDGEVICHKGESLSMADVYHLYGEHHTPFSDDDLYYFSKEVSGGVIYFDSLSETAARVNKNLFISKKDIDFDIEATDNAISTYIETGYMFIKDIDSFLVFPNVGYEWNEYLLETYLMYFSRKYALYNNGRSLNNVAGAVVRRDSGYDDFSDVCADALANSECVLTKDKALDYLGEVNLLTRRSYRKIDSVLVKAKQIRNRKE